MPRKLSKAAKVQGFALLAGAVTVVTLVGPPLYTEMSTDPTVAKAAAGASRAKTISILGSGDIMAHPPTWEQASKNYLTTTGQNGGYDFAPMFRTVRSAISSADLAICHLETPLGDGAPQDFPKFKTPVEMATAIKVAGYDACSTSSNHTLDQGEPGVYRTLKALDGAGLGHTGSYATQQASITPTIYTVKGVKVGHLSYAMHFNGNKAPAGKEWLANLINPKAITDAAHRTRVAGAEIIVLSIHWGTEGQNQPDAEQLTWAKQLIVSPDIDLILGAHAHVVQPFEKVGEKWIVYGMGNTLARHDFPTDNTRAGVMPRFTFTQQPDHKWKITNAEAIPIWLSLRPEVYVVNLSASLNRMSKVDDRRSNYETARKRIVTALDLRGAIKAGLVVA